MKITEIEAGKTYQYDTATNWTADSLMRASNRYPVRIDDLTRYKSLRSSYQGPNKDSNVRVELNGEYLRGTVPGDPRSRNSWEHTDRIVYVRPRYLRMEYTEFCATVERNQVAAKAERDRRQDADLAASDRVALLRQRAGRAALAVNVTHTPTGYGRHNPEIRVSMSADDLAALLDRLDAVETGRAEAFAAGVDIGDQYGGIDEAARLAAYRGWIKTVVASGMTTDQAAEAIKAVDASQAAGYDPAFADRLVNGAYTKD